MPGRQRGRRSRGADSRSGSDDGRLWLCCGALHDARDPGVHNPKLNFAALRFEDRDDSSIATSSLNGSA